MFTLGDTYTRLVTHRAHTTPACIHVCFKVKSDAECSPVQVNARFVIRKSVGHPGHIVAAPTN